MTRYGILLTIFLLYFGGIPMVPQSAAPGSVILEPSTLVLSGPNQAQIRFHDPIKGLYRRAEITRPGRPSVTLKFENFAGGAVSLVDGLDAKGNNFYPKARLQLDLHWSLALWSLDGLYIVLTTYTLDHGKVDIRNTRSLAAYDTTTGEGVSFKSKSTILSNDTFIKWSPSEPNVALLYGRGPGNTTEEARIVK